MKLRKNRSAKWVVDELEGPLNTWLNEGNERAQEAVRRNQTWGLVQWAVDALHHRIPRGDTIVLDPVIDEDFALAVAIAPYTIGGTGVAPGRMIWDGNDTGTSAAFRLTDSEHALVLAYMQEHGAHPGSLVLLERGRRTSHM